MGTNQFRMYGFSGWMDVADNET